MVSLGTAPQASGLRLQLHSPYGSRQRGGQLRLNHRLDPVHRAFPPYPKPRFSHRPYPQPRLPHRQYPKPRLNHRHPKPRLNHRHPKPRLNHRPNPKARLNHRPYSHACPPHPKSGRGSMPQPGRLSSMLPRRRPLFLVLQPRGHRQATCRFRVADPRRIFSQW